MQTLAVLVIVNVEVALSQGNLNNCVWLIDNTGSVSTGQGTNELITNCYQGQNIQWSVVPVVATSSVAIQSFGGQAIPSVINPVLVDDPGANFWAAQISSTTSPAKYQYTMTLLLENTSMTFDPFLNVQKAT